MNGVKPSKKKLLFRTIFMFCTMTTIMQVIIRMLDPTQLLGMVTLSFSGMLGGMGANYAWEYIWVKATGRVEI